MRSIRVGLAHGYFDGERTRLLCTGVEVLTAYEDEAGEFRDPTLLDRAMERG